MWRPTEEEKQQLRILYESCPHTVDRMPYTAEFEELYLTFGQFDVSRNEVFCALANMRKRKQLPTKSG